MPLPGGAEAAMATYLTLHSPACSQPDSNRLAPGQTQAAESLSDEAQGKLLASLAPHLGSVLSPSVWPDLRAFP